MVNSEDHSLKTVIEWLTPQRFSDPQLIYALNACKRIRESLYSKKSRCAAAFFIRRASTVTIINPQVPPSTNQSQTQRSIHQEVAWAPTRAQLPPDPHETEVPSPALINDTDDPPRPKGDNHSTRFFLVPDRATQLTKGPCRLPDQIDDDHLSFEVAAD